MSVERMVTEAILADHFSPVLRKIAGEQDEFARRSSRLNMTGNVMIGAGSAMLAFGAKSIQAAGKVDEFRKVVEKVRGANEAAFATDFVDQFDKHSSFAYFDLIDAAQRLEIQHGDLKKSFADVADTAATSGRSLMDVVRVYDAIKGGGRVGLGLSVRGGLAQFGIQPKDIFEAEGIPYNPKNLQNSMTPDQLLDGWHKVLVKTGKSGYDSVAATSTLRGAKSMIEGATERLEKNIGEGDLPKTIEVLNKVAGAINNISDSVKNVPGFGDKLMLSGGGLIAAGAIYKSAAAFRDWRSAVNLAKIAGDAERAGEKAKVPVAEAEGAAVNALGGKYGGLKERLSALGTTMTAGTQIEGAFASTLGAGIVTIGAYAVALAGLITIGYEVVSMFKDAGDASTSFEQSTAAMRKAESEGYDLKRNGGKAVGYDALPVWKQVGEQVVNGFADFATFGAYKPFDTDNGGITATSDAESRARAKLHGRPYNGVTATMLREQEAARKAAADAAREAAQQAAADAANNYQLPPDVMYKMQHDKRQFDFLNRIDPDSKREEAARKTEIDDLMKARDLLLDKAKLATDPKAKYRLMGQADEYDYEARNMDNTLEKKKDKRSKLDKAEAQILGGGGLSEEEIVKRAGIGGAFFAGHMKKVSHTSPLKSALTALAKKPLILNLHLGDKPFAQIKSEIKDETFMDVLKLLETSNGKSLYGGYAH